MHKCVRCGNVFEDNDNSILRGCSSCGSVFFVYVKDSMSKVVESVNDQLKKKDTTLEKELEKQIRKRKSVKREKVTVTKPEKTTKKQVIIVGGKKYAVEDIFGMETVKMPKDGVYEINIDALMRDKPVIILEKGKVFFIHLPELFERLAK